MSTITAVIPIYNRAKIVGGAIDSVLSQAMPASWSIDILIVDDGSTDDLAAALQPYEGRITCLRQEKNTGAASARNRGISAARGDYIAFLDSDDSWLSGKLAGQIAFMEAGGFAATCTAYLLHRQGRPTIVSPRYSTGALGLSDLVWGCFVSPGSTLVCRREIFDEIGLLDIGLQRLEDWDWLLRFTQTYNLGFLKEPFAHVDVAPQNNISKVFAAAERLRSKHIGSLSPQEVRHFMAALELERAAAYFRSGRVPAALFGIVKSLLRVPFGNAGVASVLHNYAARPNL